MGLLGGGSNTLPFHAHARVRMRHKKLVLCLLLLLVTLQVSVLVILATGRANQVVVRPVHSGP